MLRPIDTQTIYQQTPEVSNRQQALKEGESMQQDQFAHIMNKQTEQKQKVVIETKENARTDNQLDKRRGRNAQEERKKYKNKKNDTRDNEANNQNGHIDLRI